MSFPALPFRLIPLAITANSTLNPIDMRADYGLFVLNTGGLTITLPAAEEDMALNFTGFVITNNAASSSTISCTGGFPNGQNSITLAAGKSSLIFCTQNSSGGYFYIAIGV